MTSTYLGQGLYRDKYGMVIRKTKPRKKTAQELAELRKYALDMLQKHRAAAEAKWEALGRPDADEYYYHKEK